MQSSPDVPASAYGAPAPAPSGAHVTIEKPRCVYCKRMLAYRVTTPYEIKCSRCGRRQGRE